MANNPLNPQQGANIVPNNISPPQVEEMGFPLVEEID